MVGQEKLLIVEDDPLLVTLLKQLMIHKGCETLARFVRDYETAQAAVTELGATPKLYLLDDVVPRSPHDGSKFNAALPLSRQIREINPTGVIAYASGNSLSGIAMGKLDVLAAKPYDLDQLVGLIGVAISTS